MKKSITYDLFYSLSMTKSKIPFLGEVKLFWCKTCNIPLIDDFKCNICGNIGFKVNITPPGDVRPGFSYDIENHPMGKRNLKNEKCWIFKLCL